ncbi:MAG: glycoside hydrolase [Ferruginibacter sp.]|uniref:glycoside hydrolase family 97 protein n=1 Tax=Ferruginibacter sp. TaxID=1940288 RepID=UPI00265B2AD8|nr:glycoside hydrolase family 97 protein [Ferruginibacter sp.]MDB5279641.1 glycoside hydrolase [Ferruginibacter sp.]
MKKYLLLPVLLGCVNTLFAQKKVSIESPDNKIQFTFSAVSGRPEYAIQYQKTILINHSSIGLTFIDNDFFGYNIKTGHVLITGGTDDYVLPEGKTSKVYDHYSEALIPMLERAGKMRTVNLRVRVFNDGVGFRYEFPQQKNWNNYMLTDEHTSFRLSGNPTSRVAFLENFTTSHEHRYNLMPLNAIANDTLMDMPALFEFPGNIFMGITEANLVDYAGMSLIKRNGILFSQLSPLPGQKVIKVKAILPHHTPWRVMMISDRVGALIESNILTNLSEPCKIQDLGWLHPGKASFHWWNGDVLPDTSFEAGVNFNFNKYYIDFCARNHIEFHTIIGNRGVAWYQNDGIEYQPGPNTDVTKPRPGLDIQALCDYAKTKGVGIRFWVHWQALYPKLDTAFALFQKWGITGMMVDFLDRDDQEMVNIQEEILQKAAAHHLEIQFHGAFKPTGLSRTYPNESTREGTLNYENDKWGNLITPDDDIEIPFTRLLAGPTDYHLGGFRAMPSTNFKTQVTRPHVLGTRCHMLAMYVILENHLSMVCDYPEAYEGADGFDFIRDVPTVWDSTVVPGAATGQWVAIARRKGTDWYIGTITNSTSRTITIPLNFLAAGKYNATIYKDGPNAVNNPNFLIIENKFVTASDKLEFNLPSGGGAVIKLNINNK